MKFSGVLDGVIHLETKRRLVEAKRLLAVFGAVALLATSTATPSTAIAPAAAASAPAA